MQLQYAAEVVNVEPSGSETFFNFLSITIIPFIFIFLELFIIAAAIYGIMAFIEKRKSGKHKK